MPGTYRKFGKLHSKNILRLSTLRKKEGWDFDACDGETILIVRFY
jgi:hypothetical protein